MAQNATESTFASSPAGNLSRTHGVGTNSGLGSAGLGDTMDGETQPHGGEQPPREVAGRASAKPGEGEAMAQADAVDYAIERELRLVEAAVSDPVARERLKGAVLQRYEDRVAKIRHDTRETGTPADASA